MTAGEMLAGPAGEPLDPLSHQGPAAEPVDRAELKSASVRGVGVNIAAQALRLVMQFAYQVLIARMLLPRDFGLAALAAPMIAFIQLFADLGLTQATVQRATISQRQLSFLFCVNAGLGFGLTLVAAAAAPLAARFYGDPRVAPLVVAYGSLFAIGGLYTQHLALLNRRMRFGLLALVDLASYAVGAAAGLVAGHLGYGVWALFINSLATSLSMLVLAWSVSRWAPSRPGTEGARALLKFGGDLTGLNIFNFFARNMDNVLVGRFDGVVSVGFYDRAYKLCLLPFNQIGWPFGRVAGPLLARTLVEPDLYRRAYARLLQAMLLLSYPAVVFAVVMAEPLVRLGLGERWLGVVPIFRILGLDALVAPIGSSLAWLFISQGRTGEMRTMGVLTSCVFVAAFATGVTLHGAVGVACGYVAAGLFEVLLVSRKVTRRGPVAGGDLLAAVAPNLAAAAAAGAVLVLLRPRLDGLAGLAGAAGAAYAVFALALCLFPQGRELMRAIADNAGRALGKLRR